MGTDPEMGHTRAALAGFLMGAAGMFAVMYSTQAILPELSRDFGVSAAQAGLTVSIVILVLAAGAWVWGPLSDRWGRKNTLVLASALVSVPTLASALAPTFGVLLACRAVQGLCMPGLLTVGAPYVVEVFGPRLGGRAMGLYITALVSGGIIGRVGVALVATATGWRWPVGALALLPAAGAVVMARTLPHARPRRSPHGAGTRSGGSSATPACSRRPPPRARCSSPSSASSRSSPSASSGRPSTGARPPAG